MTVLFGHFVRLIPTSNFQPNSLSGSRMFNNKDLEKDVQDTYLDRLS